MLFLLLTIVVYSVFLLIGNWIFKQKLSLLTILLICAVTVLASLLPSILGMVGSAIVFYAMLCKVGRVSPLPDALVLWIFSFGLGSLIIYFGIPLILSLLN